MVKQLTVFLLLLCSFSSAAISQLSASIDKNPVQAGESFILTVEANDKINTSALRTDALLKDFVVGNTSASSQTQIINSDIRHSTVWSIMLISRTPGQYVIPAFTIDNVSSDPITVSIVAAQQATANQAKEVFLETSVDHKTAYLQSTIQYTLKLYLGLEIQRGSLSEPVMENANVKLLSKEEDLSEIRDGIRYRLIKRVYAITPQRSGDYTVKSPLFNGELVLNQRRSFFSGFNNTKPVSVVGDDIEINVLPFPDNYVGQWLPSEFVTLSEEWQPDSQSFNVGDSITRIVTLTAVGVSEEQLPEISVEYPDGVKTYPDQSTLNSAIRDNQLVAQRKDSVAIVPSKPGTLTLPEIKVPWWNTRTNTMAYATLPAKTIEIKPGANQVVAPPVVATPEVAPAVAPSTQSVTEIKEVAVNSPLTWAFLAAWLLTLLLWLLHVRHLTAKGITAKATTSQTAAAGRSYWNQFEAACKADNAAQANSELLRWGRSRWPEQGFSSSLEVALYLNEPEVINAVKALQHHLYGSQSVKWHGKNLLNLVSQNKFPKASKASESLNPLHPA